MNDDSTRSAYDDTSGSSWADPTAFGTSPFDGRDIDDPAPHGRHPVNVTHLVMGVAFLGLAAVWGLLELGVVGDTDLRWFLPVPWLAAGLAGVLAVVVNSRRSERRA